MQAPGSTPEQLRAEVESLRQRLASFEAQPYANLDPPGFFDLSRDLLCVLGSDGYLRRTNHAFQDTLGYAEADLTQQPLTAFVHPDDLETVNARWAELQERPRTERIEFRFLTKTGSYAWLSWTLTPYPEDEVFYGTASDVSSTHQAEAQQEVLRVVAQLCLNSEALAPLCRTIPRLVSVQLGFPMVLLERYDEATDTLMVIGAHGLPTEETPYPATDSLSGRTARTGRRIVETELAETEKPHPHPAFGDRTITTFLSVPVKTGDQVLGVLSLADVRSRPLSDSLLLTLQLIANDVAQQMKLQATREELATRDATLRTLFEGSLRAQVLLDANGCVDAYNPAAEALSTQVFGKALHTGVTLETLVPSTYRSALRRHVDQALDGEPVHDVHALTLDGQPYWFEATYAPIQEDGVGRGAYLTVLDVSERMRAEHALRQREERYHSLVAHVTELVVILDERGRIQYPSPSMEQALTIEATDLIDQHLVDLIHPDDADAVQAAVDAVLDGSAMETCTCRIRKADDLWLHLTIDVRDSREQPGIEGLLITAQQDVTATVDAQNEREQAQRQLQAVLAALPDILLQVTRDGIVTAVHAGRSTEPFAAEDMLGQHLLDVLPPALGTPLMQSIKRAFEVGFVESVECTLDKDDGTHCYEARFVHTDADEVVVFVRDINERKLAEMALQQSEERYRILAEGMQELVCLHDPDGTYTWVSPSVRSLLGYRPEELIGQNPYTLFHPDDHEHIQKASHDPVLEGAPMDGVSVRYRIRHKDGHYIWLETLTRAIMDGDGTVTRLQTSSRDVSSTVAGEDALQAERNLLRTLIDALPDYIYVKDVVGRYVLSNEAHIRYLGANTLDAIAGRTVLDFYPESIAQTLYERDLELIKTGHEQVNHEGRGLDANGDLTRWMITTQVPLHNAQGAIVGLVGVARDVTEQRNSQDALERYAHDLEAAKSALEEQAHQLAQTIEDLDEARRVAESATRLKSDFLSMMSHEIRTPLNGVIGMTGLLLDTELDEEQQEFVDVIRTSGASLLTIINDILDFSNVEAGHIDLDEHPFDLVTLLEDALDPVADEAAEKGLELVCTIDETVPRFVAGDSTRLRQIVVNLLSNAVTFTKSGEVVVAAEATPLDDDRVELHLTVRDTGIGIAPEMLTQLFDPFNQAGASTARTQGGTGLGLTICRRLSELMGGRAWAESEQGAGSTFHVTVQVAPASAPEEHEAEDIDRLKDVHVLIVDDNRASLQMLAALTRHWGMQVHTADAGIAALRWLDGQKTCHLALIDQHMPKMDGLMLARAIAPQHPTLPLVLMTPLGQRVEDERLAEQLSKPIKRAALARTLTAALQGPPPEPEVVSRTEETDASTKAAPAPDPAPTPSTAALRRRCQASGAPGPPPLSLDADDTDTDALPTERPMIEAIRSQLTELAGDDIDFVREILSDYLDVAPTLIAQIDAGLEAADANQTRDAAHTLKSSSGAIGAQELRTLCSELETLSRGGTLEGAPAMVDRIHNAFEHLQAIIQDELNRLNQRLAA